MDQASEAYSKLIKEYTGFEMPGEYWLLHHILPDSIMYVPSYLLAVIMASNWRFICKVDLVIHGGKKKKRTEF